MWVLSLLLGVLVVLAITAATGWFVAQEFAYMGVDRTRLAVLADEGDPSAQAALAVTKQTSFMLSGAQLGITVTSLVLGFIAAPTVATLLEPVTAAIVAALFLDERIGPLGVAGGVLILLAVAGLREEPVVPPG